jgi:hypothetical protein
MPHSAPYEDEMIITFQAADCRNSLSLRLSRRQRSPKDKSAFLLRRLNECLKAGCQAIGAARVGGTEEQMLFVIDAYTHRRAEESLELDDLMAHRFI